MRKKGTWRCGWRTGCKRTTLTLTTNLSSWTFTWQTWHFICFWLAPNGIPDTLSHQSLPPTTRMLAGRGGNDAFHSKNHPPKFQPFWFGKYFFFAQIEFGLKIVRIWWNQPRKLIPPLKDSETIELPANNGDAVFCHSWGTKMQGTPENLIG